MNRSAYCIEMLKLLAARGFMRKEELAKELDVNPRNIVEYRKELEAAGYDIITTSGKYGGYALDGGTLLPMQGFTAKEKKALSEALTYLKVHPDFYLYEDYRLAMDKILASSSLSETNGGMYLNDSKPVVSKEILKMMDLCESAKQHSLAITLDYKSMHAKQFERIMIHPYEILNYKGSYYCLAYSMKAKAFRNYKFSDKRMRNVVITDTGFTRDVNFDIKEHVGNIGLIQDEVYELDLMLYHETALLMSEKQVGLHPEMEWINDHTLRYHTIMEGKMEIISFLLSLGAQCKVIEPKEICEDITKILQDMMENYNNTAFSDIIIKKEK